MWKLIIVLLVPLMIIYYAMLFLQVFNVIKFTDRKFTLGRMCVPFYYWFASTQEKPSKKK